MKRASTRNVVLSKAMKHVDEETRREFREKRLQALESDNYNEAEIVQADDDAYNESDDEKGGVKRKRVKNNAKGSSTAKSKWATRVVRPLERILLDNGIVRESRSQKAAAPVEVMEVDSEDDDAEHDRHAASSGAKFVRTSGKQVLVRSSSSSSTALNGSSSSQHIYGDQGRDVDYHSIAAKPSVFPARQCFCSVCGYIGHYSCTRCGSKFCGIKCNESHKETRCFKFSM